MLHSMQSGRRAFGSAPVQPLQQQLQRNLQQQQELQQLQQQLQHLHLQQQQLQQPLHQQQQHPPQHAQQAFLPAHPPPQMAPGAPSRQMAPSAPPRDPVPQDLATLGSVGHWDGTCSPCAFNHKGGCASGRLCQFCHLCGPGEKRRRKKERRGPQFGE
uniref:C3H1-type domain-containing protein n=1 Tax=Zooxanthella nutricula TaxID=1333877 RepID=A0A7S2L2R0_9DINO